MEPPPCLKPGEPMNYCARGIYAWEVNAAGSLPGPWAGWRIAGNVLVSPDRDRITPEQLRGLLYLHSLKRHRVAAGAANGDEA